MVFSAAISLSFDQCVEERELGCARRMRQHAEGKRERDAFQFLMQHLSLLPLGFLTNFQPLIAPDVMPCTKNFPSAK